MNNTISALNRVPSIAQPPGAAVRGVRTPTAGEPRPPTKEAGSVLDQISRQWTQLNSRLQIRIAQMGGVNKELVQIQVDVNSLNLTTQAATQLGEGLSQTVKRLAQATGN